MQSIKYYFGYGSNLNERDWNKWCKENSEDGKSIRVLPGIFFLIDYELAFDRFAEHRKGGVLDVVQKTGHAVAGKLFEVDDFGALEKKENCPNSYVSKEVCVMDEEGKETKAITYVVKKKPDEGIPPFVKPHPDYLNLVIEAYEELGIAKKYPWAKHQLVAASKSHVTASGINHLFVYGTLQKGECRWITLEPFSKNIKYKQKVRGSIILVSDYPALIVSKGVVNGQVHDITDIAKALKTLDDVERYYGCYEDNLFRRVIIKSGRTSCWTYLWDKEANSYSIIGSGDWKKR